jgi:transcriptional regulator with XRE-family HTH domain
MIQERLSAYIESLGYSASGFADAIGVQRSSLSHILNGRNKPSTDFFEKVLRRFPHTDLAWLIAGTPTRPIDAPNGAPEPVSPLPVMHTPENAPAAKAQPHEAHKRLIRVVLCFSDGTFDTYEPHTPQAGCVS